MNYLLDTHILIWALTDPHKLDKNFRKILEDPGNTIYVSSLCFWEISLKHANGKLNLGKNLPEDFLTGSKKAGFTFKSLTEAETVGFYKLTDTHHKDPFDRMMIWQAICNNYTFITDDKQVKKYVSTGLRIL
jgi:PIN domain nuclease of toxin-antitoxin system